MLLGGSAAASSPAARRVGFAPRLPPGARVVGALSSATRMSVTVVLAPRDPAGLAAYATAVSTPGSSVFHQYLSVAQFRARFGTTDGQISAVQASLRTHGIHPGAVTANGLSIPLTTTAGAIGHAFSTSISRVTLANGRSAFANSQAPQLDPSIAGVVQDVVGLNDLSVRRPLAVVGTRHATTAAPHIASCSGAAGSGAYTAQQIALAYGFTSLAGAGDVGAGQTVAALELESNVPSDIDSYRSCYGIATGTVAYVQVDGGAPPLNLANQDGLETELDIENVVGLAPAANVAVYQAPNSDSGTYDAYNAMVSANTARAITTSWGECEPALTAGVANAEGSLFQEAAAQGQSVFAAAGDDGSSDCYGLSPSFTFLAVDDPASQPFVTGVGGTSISALGPPPAEKVWNNGSGAPGGGVSTLWPRPSYQSGVPGSLSQTNREVPDVSAEADPNPGYAVYWDGAWARIGGTSGAAPLWAALITIVNDWGACHGSPIGFANPALYRAAAGAYASDFNDITSGNNALSGTGESAYSAGPGYDMASGLGSPNIAGLAVSLCAATVRVSNPGAQTSHVGQAVNMRVTATDAPGKTLTYSAVGLPPGLSISSATGMVSGVLTSPGAYTVTVHAVDRDASAGNASFIWTVYGLPRASRGSLTGVGEGRPKLSFTLAAGTGAPALKKIVLTLPKGLSFSRNGLKRGVSVNGSHRLKLSGGKLIITLSVSSKARVTIGPPALGESRSLGRHKRLVFAVQAVDASGFAAKIQLRLKPS